MFIFERGLKKIHLTQIRLKLGNYIIKKVEDRMGIRSEFSVELGSRDVIIIAIPGATCLLYIHP